MLLLLLLLMLLLVMMKTMMRMRSGGGFGGVRRGVGRVEDGFEGSGFGGGNGLATGRAVYIAAGRS